MVGRAQAWWIGVALWLSWALGLAMFAHSGGAQTASIVAFQFAPAALVAPLWLLRKPRPGPRAADGCRAVRRLGLCEAEVTITALCRPSSGRVVASDQHRGHLACGPTSQDKTHALTKPSNSAPHGESLAKGICYLF